MKHEMVFLLAMGTRIVAEQANCGISTFPDDFFLINEVVDLLSNGSQQMPKISHL
jgi:hypothetical protein